uniref:Thioredoxin domain-containing protein n=1 Tax=Ciona savignyi TaxID=51511 RepID=H2Y8E7_CIOSA
MTESLINTCPTSLLEYETNYTLFQHSGVFNEFLKPLKNCHNVGNDPVFPVTILMSVSQLLMHLGQHEPGVCAVVLFYATWCPFSMKMTPHYNALGRLFPTIPIVAVEVETQLNTFSSNQLRFGTISVPNLLIFQGPRAISRYNQSTTELPHLIQYMQQYIDVKSPDGCYNSSCIDVLTDQDYVGPLPTKLDEDTDWVLLFSCLLVLYFVLDKLRSKVL